MKIEEVLNEMWRTPIEAVDEAAMESWIKALEQHHKDLMGLVEAWTNKIGPAEGSLYSAGRSDAFRKCRNDLSSLINPKD